MIEGTTKSGFRFALDEDALDDYELVEALCDVDNGNIGAITKVVDMLLGKEQKCNLKEHLRSEKGKVSAAAMCDEVAQIFELSNKIKNS